MLLTCVCADAGRTAAALGVEHTIVNLRDIFLIRLLSRLSKNMSRVALRTHAFLCNRHIKFPALIKHADSIGAEYIATGHYAQVEHDASGRVLLKKGADPQKDQSYVLYILPQTILTRLLLPLGRLRKAETRAVARLLGLAAAERPRVRRSVLFRTAIIPRLSLGPANRRGPSRSYWLRPEKPSVSMMASTATRSGSASGFLP